jgi:hypothetical protein
MQPLDEQDFYSVANLQASRQTSAIPQEPRRFQRVRIRVFGRYMLDDGQEYPCRITNMSPGGMAICGLVAARPSRRVVVYADHLGRIEAIAVRPLHNGFAAEILASERKRDRLAVQLTWLANRRRLDCGQRADLRVAPHDFRTTLTLPNGTCVPCTVTEMTASGATIACKNKLPLGVLATIGSIQSRIVDHIDGHVIVEFTRLRSLPSLQDMASP